MRFYLIWGFFIAYRDMVIGPVRIYAVPGSGWKNFVLYRFLLISSFSDTIHFFDS